MRLTCTLQIKSFLLLDTNKLAKRVTGTASTDMSAVAPALKMCLFLLLELFSLMADISFHICELISYLSGSSALRSLK